MWYRLTTMASLLDVFVLTRSVLTGIQLREIWKWVAMGLNSDPDMGAGRCTWRRGYRIPSGNSVR